MPSYDYKCTNCIQSIDVIQSIKEIPLEICPYCKNKTLKREISTPAFHFKGSGFYSTDYAK